MAYMNPGYAATQALQQYETSRRAQERQDMLDRLAVQQKQIEIEDHQARIQQEQQDRERKDIETRVATLVPGDVPDADLQADYQRVMKVPLPVKITPAQEGPVQEGEDPLPGEQRMYLGTPQYRMQQMQTAQAKQLQDAKAQALGAIDQSKPETLQAAMAAGATPAEIKSVIESQHYTDPNAPVPIVRIGRNGKLETLGSAPKNAHFQNEPAPVNVNVGQGGKDLLTDEALTFSAERVLAGGPEPAFGSGTPGAIARQRFMTRLEEVARARGISAADLAKIQMRFKADSAAAAQLAKTYETTEAFSDTARENLKLLDAVMDKIPDSNYAAYNWLARGFARATGNVDVSAFDTYRRSVANEFARIISQANGGVLTDTARKETDELVNPNASTGQIRSAIAALEAEAQNRTTQYGKRLDALAPGAKPNPPAAPTNETPEQRRQRLMSRGYLKPQG